MKFQLEQDTSHSAIYLKWRPSWIETLTQYHTIFAFKQLNLKDYLKIDVFVHKIAKFIRIHEFLPVTGKLKFRG